MVAARREVVRSHDFSARQGDGNLLLKRADAATPIDVLNQIARIHADQLKAGFLPLLGPSVLQRIYRHAAAKAYLFFLIQDEEVVAFAMGTVDAAQFYREFAIRNFVPVSLALLVRPKVLTRALSGVRYAGRSSTTGRQAELLSIAVDPRFARRRAGSIVFEAFRKAVGQAGQKSFRITMAETQAAAFCFYRKMGCEFGPIQNIGGLNCYSLTCGTSS